MSSSAQTDINNSDQTSSAAEANAAEANAAEAKPAQTLFEQLAELSLNPDKLNSDILDRLASLVGLQSKMSDMLISRFPRNIAAFKKYIPDIAKFYEHYRPQKTMEFFCLDNGIPNVIFKNTGKAVYPVENPLLMCQKQVDEVLKLQGVKQGRYNYEHDPFGQIHYRYMNQAVAMAKECQMSGQTANELGQLASCIMFGCGLGYQVGYLFEKVDLTNLILVEPDLDLFFASLHTFDWAPLLEFLHENHQGIYFMLGASPDTLFRDLQNYYRRHGKFLSAFVYPFIHYNSPQMKPLIKVVEEKNYLNFSSMGFFDDHLFGTSHAIASMKAGKKFVRDDVNLPKYIADMPVFIVGSGPSLDNDIAFIKKNQDKALIFACGTALDTLYHAGVQPDFYGVTERHKIAAEASAAIPDKEFVQNCILIAGDVAHPDTVSQFKDTAIFGKPDEPFFWLSHVWLEKAKHVRPIQVMNPLVGNLGVAATCTLGFKRIYLFGIDNGRKLGTEAMHSKYTNTYTAVSDKGGAYNISNVLPGNFGGQVQANFFYKLSVNLMEEVLGLSPHTECFNCSDGAAVEGAKPLHSKDLEKKFLKRKDLDKKRVHDFFCNELTMSVPVTDAEIKAALDVDKFNKLVNTVEEMVTKPAADRNEYVKKLESVSEVLHYVEDSKERFFSMILTGTTQGIFMTAMIALYRLKDEKEAIAKADSIINLSLHILSDAKELYALLPNYVLGDHQQYFGGKIGRDYEDSKAPAMPAIHKLYKDDYKDPLLKFVKHYD